MKSFQYIGQKNWKLVEGKWFADNCFSSLDTECSWFFGGQQTLKPDDDYVLPHQRLWTFDVLVCLLSVTEHCLSQPLVCGTVFHRTSLLPPFSVFCCHLKSHLFSLSYPAFWLFSHLYSARSVTHHFGHSNRYYIFLCLKSVFYLPMASLFVFLVYFLLFVLSRQCQCKWLPVKTRLRSPKWPVMCRAGRTTLLTHSLILTLSREVRCCILWLCRSVVEGWTWLWLHETSSWCDGSVQTVSAHHIIRTPKRFFSRPTSSALWSLMRVQQSVSPGNLQHLCC